MTTVEIGLFVLAGLFAGAFVAGFVKRPEDPIRALERDVIERLRVPKSKGRAELMDRVEAASARHPGQTYRWYLEWLITDLERAQR